MNRTGRVLGLILVILGALFLLKNLDFMGPFFNTFTFRNIVAHLWPSIFLILPGLLFHYGFFAGRRRDPGLLVPGGMLLVWGVVFQINMLIGWWDVLWPAYIFAVAFGLFELYAFGNREKGLLIPIFILGGLSVIFFAAFSFRALLGTGQFATPLVLILIGLAVIFGGKNKRQG